MSVANLKPLIPGQTWLTGVGAPNPQFGYKTQFYLDSATGEVYQKFDTLVWILVGDITGAGAVLSVNEQTGAVVLDASDVGAIPASEKGVPLGVATLGGDGLVTASQLPAAPAAPVLSVNGEIGVVVLETGDIAESTNLYFTDTRAQNAAVIDSTAGGQLNQAPSVHSTKEYVTNAVAAETAARQAQDALLIPLTQKGAPSGVATLGIDGKVPASQLPAAPAAPVLSVNGEIGVVVLKTGDIAESTNLYFTDTRAQTAAVIDSTAGGQLSQAPSVHSTKEYVTNAVAAETAARQAEDALLIPLSQKGVADGVASLDNTGKVPASQIPPTAITSVVVVATIAERDALTPQEGDFCVVTDVNETFVYDGADWIELQVGSAVISVNGETGAVSLSTTDISEGSNLYYTDTRARTATVINSSAGNETDQAMSVAAAKMFTFDSVQTETLAREAADALLIPLTQKGIADGVATLGSDGLVTSSQLPAFPAAPVTSVNTLTGAVLLTTTEISEGSNLYYTDTRARTATVINSSAGNETDQAMSVAAAKMFTSDSVQTETLAREAADALLIPLSQKGQPLGVATLDADGKIDPSLVPAGTSEIGTPTRGTYAGGLLSFTPTTTIANATDETNLILAKLAPAKPPNLSTKTISLTTSYSAKQSGTNTLRSNVTDILKPQINTVSQFYDGDAGTLTAEIDSTDAGSVVLTPLSQAGTYGALVVTADVDYYAGQSGKEGFWRALSAYILPTTNLSYASHTYQMRHSTTGDTNILIFYVDDPVSPTISGSSVDLSSVTTGYVSGVPKLNTGSQIKVDFDINSAVGKFFNSTKIADISSSVTSTTNIAPDASGYTEGQIISIADAVVSISSGAYSESPSVSIRGYNSKGNSGSSSSVNLNSRVDNASNESSRKTSGSGEFPASGYGGTYDSTQSLKTVYTEEMQMLNGSYQFPAAVDYSSNTPVAGPNYSSGMGSGVRWVTFNPTAVSNASAFTLTFNGAQNFAGVETSGIQIYAKVEGVTGWIDCNASYPGVGNPSADGDAAMIFGSSTATIKRVTFGAVTRTGTLYIRIGLPSGSNKKFSSITVGSII